MQPRVERPLLYLKNFVGAELNGLRVTMEGAELQRAENQEIQRPLKKLDAFLLFFSRILGDDTLYAPSGRMSR
jgi:hypothetical protein